MSDRPATYESVATPGRNLRVGKQPTGAWNFQIHDSPSTQLGITITDTQAQQLAAQIAGDQVDYKAEMERAQARAEAYKDALFAHQRLHTAYMHQVSENEAMLAAKERSDQARETLNAARSRVDATMQALEQWS